MAGIRNAALLSTGDEIVTGRTVDTNAAYLADRLTAVGIEVVAVLAVGDVPDRLVWAWREGLARADMVVSTGGLGPTVDDRTTEALATVSGRRLIRNEEVARHIRSLFEARGRRMPENNLRQADLPEGAEVLHNPIGTAPGFRLRLETPAGPRWAVVLPGVPREMKRIFEDEVLPWLQVEKADRRVFLSRTFQTFGLSESALDELVAGAVDPSEGRIAFRAAFPQIAVRVTVAGEAAEAGARLERLARRIRDRLGEFCYAEGETTMEAEVGRLLRERGETLAVAESCTGGLIGHRITEVAGSSEYFVAGVVAYQNEVKRRCLGVRSETLARCGAVSVETAVEMAEGVRQRTGATWGLATTGIAGPGGGSAEKPVGTVCIALAGPDMTRVHRYQLWGERSWIKLLTSQIALDWVRRACLGRDPLTPELLRR